MELVYPRHSRFVKLKPIGDLSIHSRQKTERCLTCIKVNLPKKGYSILNQMNEGEIIMKKINLELDQLTCPTCVTKIQNKLDQTKGIENAKVLFTSSKVKADYDETQLSQEDIVLAIESLGFEVLKVK